MTNVKVNITDENGNPVTNGTAILTVNGTNYTGSIVNSTVTFKNINLNNGNYTGVITYLSNDIYNPSSTTVNVEINKVNTIPTDPVKDTTQYKINKINTIPIIWYDGNVYYTQNENTTNNSTNTTEPEQNQTLPSNEVQNNTSQFINSNQNGNLILSALLVLICLTSIYIIRRKR